MTADKLKEQARAFHSKKRLGQNFLINENILRQISASLAIQPDDHVLEIGSGLGFLTTQLLQTGAKVTAVEIDSQCIKVLNELAHPQLTVIHGDFLQCDLATILKAKTKVIGNIPYQITTPILCRLLGEIGEPASWLSSIESIVLTVQKEVAQRLVAQAGDEHYSQISVLVQYFAKAELLFFIEAEDFFPVPEVTSAVVRLLPLQQPSIKCANHKLLRKIVHAGFKQRRKMLKNNLTSLALDQRQIMDVFTKLNFDPQVRAERLKLQEFALLADEISAVKQSQKDNFVVSM